MAITLRSRREIELMRKAGEIVAEVLLKLKEMSEPGVSTGQLDRVAVEMAEAAGAATLFKGVRNPQVRMPFPGAICTSINEQVVHGIPSDSVKLKEGDILGIDFGVSFDGYCGDSAFTVGIGEVSQGRQKLMDVTKKVLDVAIERMKPGVRWSRVAGWMQEYAEDAGFSVVTEYVGHGIGRQMWEDPKVPNFVSEELLENDIVLREGMVMAVEPMVNAGESKTRVLRDGWTVVTKDGMDSAHFEHTIAIIEDGCEILTLK